MTLEARNACLPLCPFPTIFPARTLLVSDSHGRTHLSSVARVVPILSAETEPAGPSSHVLTVYLSALQRYELSVVRLFMSLIVVLVRVFFRPQIGRCDFTRYFSQTSPPHSSTGSTLKSSWITFNRTHPIIGSIQLVVASEWFPSSNHKLYRGHNKKVWQTSGGTTAQISAPPKAMSTLASVYGRNCNVSRRLSTCSPSKDTRKPRVGTPLEA